MLECMTGQFCMIGFGIQFGILQKVVFLKNAKKFIFSSPDLRAPLKIHFGGQANLFDPGLRQAKSALASTKADLPSLPETQNRRLAAQKQLLATLKRSKLCGY